MGEQSDNLERVSERISGSILRFWDRTVPEFFAEELRQHVANECGYVAPGSADRILRDLRQRKVINYRVVSRSKSLYEILREPQLPLF